LGRRLDGDFSWRNRYGFTATNALIHEFDLQVVAAGSYSAQNEPKTDKRRSRMAVCQAEELVPILCYVVATTGTQGNPPKPMDRFEVAR
jgi:hypothetical protein